MISRRTANELHFDHEVMRSKTNELRSALKSLASIAKKHGVSHRFAERAIRRELASREPPRLLG